MTQPAQQPGGPFITPTPPPIGTCSTCKFWSSSDVNGDNGRCHVHAPAWPTPAGVPAYWPRTASDDWCGEYVARV